MKKISAFLFAFLVVGVVATMAQPGPGPHFNPVPLDGGISLLIAAGAALGVKKVVDARKQK